MRSGVRQQELIPVSRKSGVFAGEEEDYSDMLYFTVDCRKGENGIKRHSID